MINYHKKVNQGSWGNKVSGSKYPAVDPAGFSRVLIFSYSDDFFSRVDLFNLLTSSGHNENLLWHKIIRV